MIVATSDASWCSQVELAIAPFTAELGLSPRRLLSHAQLGDLVRQPARLWLLDENLLADVLRSLAGAGDAHQPFPCMIVRCRPGPSQVIVQLVEAGVRGCLADNASPDETLHAVRAVLSGELWISRRVLSDMLEASLRRDAARERQPADEASQTPSGLTTRQQQIAACVARGLSNKQIGRQLGISPTTVKTHLHNIFGRVGIGGRTLLAVRSTIDRSRAPGSE